MRQATALARAAIAQALAEDAAVRSGAGSLAAGRGQRRAAREANAAIDRDRVVSQRTEGERDEASEVLPHKCGRGHLLQRVPVMWQPDRLAERLVVVELRLLVLANGHESRHIVRLLGQRTLVCERLTHGLLGGALQRLELLLTSLSFC